MPLRFFNALPVSLYLPGVVDLDVAENVGVAPYQLAVDVGKHVRQFKLASLAGDVGMKCHLDQQVSQLFGQRIGVSPIYCFQNFVALFEQISFKRRVGLLYVPRATAGAAETVDYVHQSLKSSQLFI